MRKTQLLLLLHPLFLLSVALLLLNDFYLKYTYPGQLTGKLSDISGLFAFTVFLVAFFPAHKRWVYVSVILFFLWWKSPASQAFIDLLNANLHLPIERVIDYTDYVALIAVPFANYLKPPDYPCTIWQTLGTWIIGIVSFLSFTATSMIKRLTDTNRVDVNRYVRTGRSDEQIIHSLEKAGLNPMPIPAIYERDWGRQLYVRTKDDSGDTVFTALDKIHSGIYRKVGYGQAYNIPVMYIGNDSIFNLQFMLSGEDTPRTEIWLHSFEYRMKPDTTSSGMPYNQLEYSSYQISQKIGKALQKKIKKIVRDKD
jgi:hypothetical protein